MEEQRERQVADDCQTNHDERSRGEQHCRRLELRGTHWLAHGYVSRLSGHPINASIETGQMEHDHETVVELSRKLQVQGRRANLDSGAAGLFVLIGETINTTGSRLADCLSQSETKMQEHMTQCANACQGASKHTVLTIKQDQEHA